MNILQRFSIEQFLAENKINYKFLNSNSKNIINYLKISIDVNSLNNFKLENIFKLNGKSILKFLNKNKDSKINTSSIPETLVLSTISYYCENNSAVLVYKNKDCTEALTKLEQSSFTEYPSFFISPDYVNNNTISADSITASNRTDNLYNRASILTSSPTRGTRQ